jgi:hypothetical protein
MSMSSHRVLALLCCAGLWVAVTEVAAQAQIPPTTTPPTTTPTTAPTTTPPSEDRCLAAYEQGQRLRLKHALLEARAELLLCAREPCPASFRPECLQWFDEVQQLVPSVIIHVEGDVGATDVRVSIDGVVVASRLDGTPIEVDPGEHVFRFEPAGRAASEQRVVINVGQKARLLTINASKPVPASDRTTSSSRSPSLAPWIFAGVGGVALGSFAYFGATGLSQRDELTQCTPYCEQADIDNTRRRFLVADVSLAISALSFGVAVYYWLSASPASTSSATALRLEASGGSGSAYVGVRGGF